MHKGKCIENNQFYILTVSHLMIAANFLRNIEKMLLKLEITLELLQ